jgi:hypothetical protein
MATVSIAGKKHKVYKKTTKSGKDKLVIPKGYHKMPNGKIMKDSAHKKIKE